MSKPQTWRDKQAARPDPILAAVEAWNSTADPDDYGRMATALQAAHAAQVTADQCDEPGCTRAVTACFAVKDGYRRTCYEHSPWAKL